MSGGLFQTAIKEHKTTVSERALMMIWIKIGEINSVKWPVRPETKILPTTLGIDWLLLRKSI
jgi:hypothetical protein